jgi:hypothetical protein
VERPERISELAHAALRATGSLRISRFAGVTFLDWGRGRKLHDVGFLPLPEIKEWHAMALNGLLSWHGFAA